MKTTLLYSLLFVTLLGVGIGCKKEVEPVKPPVVVSPPTSGMASLPITNVDTWGNVVPFVLAPPGCRIVREEIKYPADIIGYIPERMTINGKEFLVST